MRLLMFNYEYPPLGGGGGVSHALIAGELARRHRVVVVTSAFPGLPQREIVDQVEVVRVPVLGRNRQFVASLSSMLSYPVSAYRAGMRLLAREEFDLVNAHFAVPTGPGSLAVARRARLPHVLSVHGGDIYDPTKRLSPHRNAPLRAAVRSVLRGSSVVVAQSTDTGQNVARLYGFDGPLEVIPLGIRPPVTAPKLSRGALGLPADRLLAVTVGRLVERKGVSRLVRALADDSLARLDLVVIGDGPEGDALRSLVAKLGVAGRVHFVGAVDNERKAQLLAAADLYVSASLHEGFGLVYLEAMAAGLAVVAPDHGGQTDFLADDVTGRVVPAHDQHALVRAIAWVAEHPDARTRYARENLTRWRRFTVERCAERYERLFERVRAGHEAAGETMT